MLSVMFGDAGHGLIILLAGIWMICKEDGLVKAAEESEIFGIFFGGNILCNLFLVMILETLLL